MKKKRWKKIIFILACGSAIISLIMGFVYYSSIIEDNKIFKYADLFFLSVRNAFSGFVFTPAVAINDVITGENSIYNSNPILTLFYFVALAVAPICTVSIIGYYLKKLFISIKNAFIFGESPIAVFGNAEQVFQFFDFLRLL